jgi:hypothetical protein
MKRYKVRFHLAKGENYMKWQVFDLKHNHKDYYDPEKKYLILRDCKLGNHPSTAKKIYEGASKTVCAWIECESVSVYDDEPTQRIRGKQQYKYNPKKNPHWFTDKMTNVDGRKLTTIYTINKKIYG